MNVKRAESDWKSRWKHSIIGQLFHNKPIAALGLIILVLFVLVAVFADVIAPFPMVDGRIPYKLVEKLQAPSLKHLLGTDSMGIDVLSYLIYGARTSVILAVTCTLISTVISLVIGVTSAVLGGWFDLLLQRFTDAWTCIPSMLILLILMSIMGSGVPQLIFAISVPGGIGGARMMRSAAFAVKDSGYNKMAQMLGGGPLWKMIRHVTPNIMPVILMNLAGSIGMVVMMEASLSFLGFGVDLNTPSWGAMLTAQGQSNMYVAPWLALCPGIAIAILVFASAMLGDGLRDILDPRLKGGVGSYRADKIKKLARKLIAEEEKASLESQGKR